MKGAKSKVGRGEPKTIDEYIAGCEPEVRPILRKIRATIRKAAPGAEEVISYRMPAFKLKRILVYIGAFQKHIGLFPPVKGDKKLVKEAAKYAGPKGNLQFALDEPIPYGLIGKIVKARVKEEEIRGRRSNVGGQRSEVGKRGTGIR